jgi:hypothetical protein
LVEASCGGELRLEAFDDGGGAFDVELRFFAGDDVALGVLEAGAGEGGADTDDFKILLAAGEDDEVVDGFLIPKVADAVLRRGIGEIEEVLEAEFFHSNGMARWGESAVL